MTSQSNHRIVPFAIPKLVKIVIWIRKTTDLPLRKRVLGKARPSYSVLCSSVNLLPCGLSVGNMVSPLTFRQSTFTLCFVQLDPAIPRLIGGRSATTVLSFMC